MFFVKEIRWPQKNARARSRGVFLLIRNFNLNLFVHNKGFNLLAISALYDQFEIILFDAVVLDCRKNLIGLSALYQAVCCLKAALFAVDEEHYLIMVAFFDDVILNPKRLGAVKTNVAA